MIILALCAAISLSIMAICFVFLRASAPSIQGLQDRWRTVNTARINMSELRNIIANTVLVYFYAASFLDPGEEIAGLLWDTRRAARKAALGAIFAGASMFLGTHKKCGEKMLADYGELVKTAEFLTVYTHPDLVKTFSRKLEGIV